MENLTTADEAALPALLRAARGSYGLAITDRLSAAGFDDIPRNGSYVLGGMVNRGGSAGQLVRQLGISKQAASQLIDTLVIRGYLTRDVNAEDRRRILIDVTDRGRAAAAEILAGVEAVDTVLAQLISTSELAGLRAGLVALCDIRDRMEEEARAHVSFP